MILKRSFRSLHLALVTVLALSVLSLTLWAQSAGVLRVVPPKTATGKRGQSFTASVSVLLRDGYHVNSNTPSDEYLIPLRLTWDTGDLKVDEVLYPEPRMETYSFSKKPLSVFTGNFQIDTRFSVPSSASASTVMLPGELRYQACNHDSCLPPKTVAVKLPVQIQ